MAYDLKVSFDDILDIYSRNHRTDDGKIILQAYEYAERKHAGVTRGTGEAYICHPLRVAKQIAEWGASCELIAAAILHDIVEDCDTTIDELEARFGHEIAQTVDDVTALSDRDFEDHTLTKKQKNILSDAKLQRRMNAKAICIKVADRIDNLNTLSGVSEEKRIPKAEHTREIIIPMAMLMKAYHFVNILEELCFMTEHARMYNDILRKFRRICFENSKSCYAALDALNSIFDPQINHETNELDRVHRYIISFNSCTRSCISLYRQIAHMADNIMEDWDDLLCKENVALYDINVIVSDELMEENSRLRPNDVFFAYFDQALSAKGFYLVNCLLTTHRDARYYLLADGMDNMYRLFVRTETEYQHYMYGNIIDDDGSLSIPDINEIDPRDSYNEKIKVFCRNGACKNIDKGATVLDLAFLIDKKCGFGFDYALIDESPIHLPASTRLNDGDRITIITNDHIKPEIDWFMNVKTSLAVHHLVNYFQRKS